MNYAEQSAPELTEKPQWVDTQQPHDVTAGGFYLDQRLGQVSTWWI